MAQDPQESEPNVEPPKDEAPTLVVIDPSLEDRSRAEALESELGCTVWALDPNELTPELLEELCEAAAIVVEWNLGAYTGLDVLSNLLRHERLRRIPIALSSSRPTRTMVTLAIRSGASTFLLKPYEAGEIRARLLAEASSPAPEDRASAAAFADTPASEPTGT